MHACRYSDVNSCLWCGEECLVNLQRNVGLLYVHSSDTFIKQLSVLVSIILHIEVIQLIMIQCKILKSSGGGGGGGGVFNVLLFAA
jgi:hypothetical protein